jgi:hypothetical protein
MLKFIITVIVIWVIMFGVNIAGKHYELEFSTNGINVVWGK